MRKIAIVLWGLIALGVVARILGRSLSPSRSPRVVAGTSDASATVGGVGSVEPGEDGPRDERPRRQAPRSEESIPEDIASVCPELWELTSHLDDVCENGGNIVETIIKFEQNAESVSRLSESQILKLLEHVQCEETLALLLLALSRIDQERFVRIQPSFRENRSLEVRIAAYWGLVAIGLSESSSEKFWQEAWGRLELLTASPTEFQSNLVGQVRATNDAGAIALLTSGMKSPDMSTRNLCALLLKPSHDSKTVSDAYCQVLLHDESPVVRQTAARSLGGATSPIALQALRTAIEADEIEEVRIEAIRSLAAVVSAENTRFLVDRFRAGSSVREQRAIVTGLARSDSYDVRDFLRTLVTGNYAVCIKSDALDALALRRNDPVATNEIVGALSSEDAWIRMKAAVSLGRTGDPSVLPYLERVAQSDPSESVRQHARDSINELRK